MHWRLATVLVAAAIAAAGCGGGTDDTGGSPASTTEATSAPAGVETSDTTPEPAPGSAPEDGAEAHPSDAYFALDRVLDISIEIAGEDWDTLRHQTRTLEDVFAEIERYGLSRPFADIYTWFGATVTVDGETHADVGVRKKGFVGSQSDTKPALKLRFDKYVDGQSLGGVMERMTLNNSIQDPSMVNTCLSYRVFAAAGSPAPRCNRHRVGERQGPGAVRPRRGDQGPVPVAPLRERGGQPVRRHGQRLHDGVSRHHREEDQRGRRRLVRHRRRGGGPAGPVGRRPEGAGRDRGPGPVPVVLGNEVLVGHWDGYAGDRNNYHFYREPDGPFVFIPWGTDDTFHLKDDPNPFDNISNPPPSVLALTAIPNRLYNDGDWRVEYVARLKEILDTVWAEEELLAVVDAMAATVQQHALPEAKEAAAADTERVRKFILKRRGEILADLTPEPPEWPEPEADIPLTAGSGTLEITFQTTWGSNLSANPLEAGTISSLRLDGSEESVEGMGIFAGHSSPEERGLLPEIDQPASIVVASVDDDGSISGMTVAVDLDLLAAGATLVMGADAIAGVVWSIPPGASAPDRFSTFTEGTLELSAAGTTPGDPIAGTFSGVYGYAASLTGGDSPDGEGVGLVINELAAKGDPLDWFELHNTSSDRIVLDGHEVADSLTDAGKRVAFPAGTTIGPGAYMQFSLDKDGWPGFALGGDEELGIWLLDGTLIDSVDWDDGHSPDGQSYARVPDATGDFQTVNNPTPSAANQP